MTPIEEKRAKAKAEKAIHDAKNAVVDEILSMMLRHMPDGAPKRNGQILMMSGQIMKHLDIIEGRAAAVDGLPFDEKQSQQVLDYLTCVHVGMCEFCKQIGLEVANGTP